MKTKTFFLSIIYFFNTFFLLQCYAQNVGININGTDPNPSALLDINAGPNNDKGILIPRVQLTAINSGAPISPAPGITETGLMVFNKAAAGTAPNDVVKGFYYWDGTAWSAIDGGTSSGGGAGGWTDDGTVVRLTASSDFVGIGTASPAATSALDITSTNKGLLIPRMTTNQRDAITSPAIGLQIYNLDCKVLNYWSGTCWIAMSKALPNPGAITSNGTTVFCTGQVRTYSITAITGATSYTWTVPAGTTINSGQGTTSISATLGNISGSVCVNANNACETSGQTCLAVSVAPIPNTPGVITGLSSVNPGKQSSNYFIASVNGASAYTWAYSGTGLTISSGTGTSSIVVNFNCNATSGNLTVTANNTCGDASAVSSLAVTITTSITANAGANKFGGVAIGGSPTAAGGNATYTYSWSPSSNLSSATAANPTALCAGSTTTYTVTATDGNNCSATSTLLVTRNLTASAGAAKFGGTGIGGSPTATGGNATYTYAWSPTGDLSSFTVANPTALCTGATTTYTVTATDANSCAATSTVVVTRNLSASAGPNQFFSCSSNGTIGGSPTAAGGSGSYTYSWSPATALSSTTIANPSSSASSTTTYTVTVTDGNSCTANSSMTITIVGMGSSTATFNNTHTGPYGNMQSWTVPSGVTCVTIEVWGAQGGGNQGGAGARMKGTFTVTPGQVLQILVGQMGESGGSRGGGGGGSFVTDNSNNPLIIGGGGGGADNGCSSSGGMPGVVTGSGTSYGSYMSGGGGSNGGGGGGGQAGSGGGGGGLVGDGGSGEACDYNGTPGAGGDGTNGSDAYGGGYCMAPGGASFTNGGYGGSSSYYGGYGGGAVITPGTVEEEEEEATLVVAVADMEVLKNLVVEAALSMEEQTAIIAKVYN